MDAQQVLRSHLGRRRLARSGPDQLSTITNARKANTHPVNATWKVVTSSSVCASVRYRDRTRAIGVPFLPPLFTGLAARAWGIARSPGEARSKAQVLRAKSCPSPSTIAEGDVATATQNYSCRPLANASTTRCAWALSTPVFRLDLRHQVVLVLECDDLRALNLPHFCSISPLKPAVGDWALAASNCALSDMPHLLKYQFEKQFECTSPKSP